MRAVVLSIFIGLAVSVSQSVADPRADAEYITSQWMTREIYKAAITSQGDVITAAAQYEMEQYGVTLKNPEAFIELLTEELLDEFVIIMQAGMQDVLADTFSAQQLTDIAEFTRSEAGQAYFAALPELTIKGADMGERAMQKAYRNAGIRVAARIESEEIIVVDDPSILERLLKMLKE